MNLLRDWYQRTLSNPQVVILAVALVAVVLLFALLGKTLAPVFAAIVLAYLLEGLINRLEQLSVPRLLSVIFVFVGFLSGVLLLLFGLAPLLSRQIAQLVQQLPNYINQGQELLQRLPELYPQLISATQTEELINRLGADLAGVSQQILAWSWSSALSLISLLVLLVLVPLMVFFFLKDKQLIINWFTAYLPKDRELVNSVWSEVDRQIGNYVRGKVLEILIVGSITWVTFSLLGLQYALLLATLTGFSVLIPFIGAAVITIPIALVAFFQFGWSGEFLWVVAAYGIIQALDGNVLVPVLFSEVNDLHPVAIIVAVFFFGGIWGFWGIFFAIPLATVVNAVLRAWPRRQSEMLTPSPAPENS